MTFHSDLEKGNLWENVAILILQSLGYRYIDRCYDGAFDIEMESNGIFKTFEIKTDFTRTGNLVVEFKCNGEQSGIEKSEAETWCFIFPHDWQIWIIEADKLKKLCFTANTVDGGDKGRSKMYLFKKMDVVSNFRVIDYKDIVFRQISSHDSQKLPEFIRKDLQCNL